MLIPNICTKLVKTTFSEIRSLFCSEDTKNSLLEFIVLPARFPKLFTEGRRQLVKSFMIFGPTGNGKKTLIEAARKDANIQNVLNISIRNLVSLNFEFIGIFF